ncbi:MAG: DNA topoisomerase VI subunit B [Candidatus Diapherotrites archaeon]|uniref:Type 2 DNA topoisomerase 6 subunit B n=1 Tax=Candidatus Iainarchaeum sp. TaxID=3101447 RepID=A0A2D6LPN6_9ARCH|nr:DNA topoisomerase VI subunit B [Candidatus Diapherotrites archaeon]
MSNGSIEAASADEIAKEFKEHSVAEFFKKNMQMLGLTGKIKALTTIVHEYVTNSLDACEEAKILPDIEVQIKELGSEYYEVTVKDNGPGLTKETVGKALGQLLAGTKFHRMMQMRGQQGIGAAGCTMLSQITTGKASQVITGTGKGNPISLEITIDPKKNQPKIANLAEIKKNFKGTMIKAKFKGMKYVNSEQAPLEYLRRTAIANPHAQITLIEPNKKKIVFKRTLKDIPKQPLEIKPHPKGINVDELNTLAKYTTGRQVSSFLKSEFDRMGDKAISEIQKNVSFDLKKDPRQLTWEECEEIVKQFKKINFIAPRTDGLRPIGEERIRKSLNSIVQPEFLSVVTRRASVYSGGFPFQVEVGIAYGGNAGKGNNVVNDDGLVERKMEIMRFANRAPLLFDTGGCAITKAVQSIDWKRYGVRDFENAPITIFANLISVHIPYTSAGKQAISDEIEIMEELRLALMDSGRRAAQYIAGKKREQDKKMKKELFFKFIPEIAKALEEITKKGKGKIEKNLEHLVLEKLKLEEDEEEAQKISDEIKETSKDTGKKTKENSPNEDEGLMEEVVEEGEE